MKLLKTLSESISDTIVILEYSDRIKNQLLTKFKTQTKDDDQKILSLISDFQKIKDSLPSSERDITKYPYTKLKNVIANKKRNKEVDEIVTSFKKKEKGIETADLKKNINKFLDIKSALPKKGKELEEMGYLDLVKFVRDNYGKYLNKILSEKFKKEKPDLNDQILVYYIQGYFDIMNELPENTKRPIYMSFDELEHLVDSMGKTDETQKGKSDFSGIEMIYDQDDVMIFNPTTKDQCIRLKHGRSWCISREGGSNLFYNYRLSNERTIYYVINEKLPFQDLNFAVVVLVDPYGGMSLADGSNSGRYSGHSNLPWSEIATKIPWIADLKNLFVPKPLTQEEKDLHRKFKSVRVGDNPMENFSNEQEVELWLEVNSPSLSDIQYENLTPNLQKKYIALGMDLNSGKIRVSSPDVLKYYISKQIDRLKSTQLSSLRDADIALLNTPMMKKLKDELKSKFASNLVKSGSDSVEASIPNSDLGKFIGLYGFDDLFDSLPENVNQIMITNTGPQGDLAYDIPASLGRFKNLTALLFGNIVKSLPAEIGNLKSLNFLSLPNNPKLTSLPEELGNCQALTMINLDATPTELPDSLKSRFPDADGGFYWSNPT